MSKRRHSPSRPLPAAASLRVSRYDQVSGLLLAALLVLGSVTLLMFLVWLSNRLFIVTRAVPVTVLEDVGGGGSGQVLGGDQQLEEPSPEEVRDVPDVVVERSIDSIAGIVSARSLELEAVEGSPSVGTGEGTGTGDGTGPGPGGPGKGPGVPAYERWEVRLEAANQQEYARLLDFFKVELGVAGGGSPDVTYVSNVSQARPTVRVGDPKNERRLRFLQRTGELREADRQLVAKAGVKTEGRIVFHFYSEEMYRTLLTLEAERKGTRRLADVRRTVFGVRPVRGRFEFYVIDQQVLGNL